MILQQVQKRPTERSKLRNDAIKSLLSRSLTRYNARISFVKLKGKRYSTKIIVIGISKAICLFCLKRESIVLNALTAVILVSFGVILMA